MIENINKLYSKCRPIDGSKCVSTARYKYHSNAGVYRCV